MTFIFIGDVVGKGGRLAVQHVVPELKKRFNAQFVVVNGENSAAGNGLSGSCVKELLTVADVITSGDHTWDQKGFENEINSFSQVVRPANVNAGQPGRGWGVFRQPAGGEVAVISLCGHVFMRDGFDGSPFEKVDIILKNELPKYVKTIIVDFHAEATSEKLAMAAFLDGKVTAVLGTHTHVQSNDARITPSGTAAITDAGMAGADYSILGRDVFEVVKKFTTGMPRRLPVVEKGDIRVDGVAVTYNQENGRATAITSFSEHYIV